LGMRVVFANGNIIMSRWMVCGTILDMATEVSRQYFLHHKELTPSRA
jgi:hypothetical protein